MDCELDAQRTKALTIYQQLVAHYGEPAWESRLDPLSLLVTTILSQNTSDINQHKAYRRLRERFPTWEDVWQAPIEEIEEAIRPAGMAKQRAPRIKAALEFIMRERGELGLDFLKAMPVEEAKAWLTRIHGIGPKTAAIVLLFSFGMPAFPVDTHVHRVSRRLGLVPAGASPSQTQEVLERLVPPHLYYPLHVNLITHGRRVCKAQRPLCPACFLRHLCDDYQKRSTHDND